MLESIGRAETTRVRRSVPSSILLDASSFTSAGSPGPTMLKVATPGKRPSETARVRRSVPGSHIVEALVDNVGVPGILSGSAFGNVPRAAERAIFNIVGRIVVHVGRISRANNVEGGNSREAPSDTCRVRRSVPSSILLDASSFTSAGSPGPTMLMVATPGKRVLIRPARRLGAVKTPTARRSDRGRSHDQHPGSPR